MRQILLTLAAVAIPPAWGFAVHWSMQWLWPELMHRRDGQPGQETQGTEAPANPFDYQI